MIDALDEQIKLLSKQLKVPTFARYRKIQEHAGPGSSFGELLLELMYAEREQRQENNNRKRLKQARFPYTKTIDELDLSRYDGKIAYGGGHRPVLRSKTSAMRSERPPVNNLFPSD